MATPTLDRMNSDHLRALVAAVDHGTFDAAADSLRISGSAFSQRIKALERQVGQVLLARTVPVRPTAAGERMLRLARQTLALEDEARVIRANIAMTKTAEAAATDDALKSAYDTQYANAQPTTEYHAAHILVQTEDEAKAIEAQLKDGGDFAAIAKEKSTDTASGAQGGELGWFGLGRMVPEFETAVSSLEPGQISDPVKTQFGWHIVKLNEKRDSAPPPLDEVRADFENQIRQEAFQARVAELRAAATIDKVEPTVPPAALRQSDLLGN